MWSKSPGLPVVVKSGGEGRREGEEGEGEGWRGGREGREGVRVVCEGNGWMVRSEM